MKYVPLDDTATEYFQKLFMRKRKELERFDSIEMEGGLVDFYKFEGNHYALWGSYMNEDAYIAFIGVETDIDAPLEHDPVPRTPK